MYSLRFIAAAVLGLLSLGASAQVTGTLGSVTVDDNNTYYFLSPPVTMCTGGGNYVVVPRTSPNYAEHSRQIGLARAFGKTVTFYSTNNGGYCYFSYVNVAP